VAEQPTDRREPAEGLRMPRPLPSAPLLVITGMSGAGRSTAAKVLEDHDWYVVDNLPPQLLPQLRALRAEHPGDAAEADRMPRRLAVVIDSRARLISGTEYPILEALTAGPDRPGLVFLEATDEELVRRF
jgi:UPF0042 nucleotide-binding protein